MSHSPRPIEASDVGSHVKSTPEWFSLRKGGSENPELWLSLSGIVAQTDPDYSDSGYGAAVGRPEWEKEVI